MASSLGLGFAESERLSGTAFISGKINLKTQAVSTTPAQALEPMCASACTCLGKKQPVLHKGTKNS